MVESEKTYIGEVSSNLIELNRFTRMESEMNNRKLLVKKLHESYKRHESMKNYICFYCGDNADNADHVPPLNLVESYNEHERILIRCCSLCNSLLSNRPLLSLASRCEYLQERYRKRWRKDIDMPTWTENEIEELTGILKRQIIIGMKRKERALKILKNLAQLKEILQEQIC